MSQFMCPKSFDPLLLCRSNVDVSTSIMLMDCFIFISHACRLICVLVFCEAFLSNIRKLELRQNLSIDFARTLYLQKI